MTTRRIFVSGLSAQPDQSWMAQQAPNVALDFAEQTYKPFILLRICDGEYSPEFDEILEGGVAPVTKVGPQAPHRNSIAERWVQSCLRERLDHFVVLGKEHSLLLIAENVNRYNQERAHQWCSPLHDGLRTKKGVLRIVPVERIALSMPPLELPASETLIPGSWATWTIR